jgi:L-arabinokinase
VVAVFYISGHGFGHASRQLVVVNALASRLEGSRIVVRTTTPRWFVEDGADGPVELMVARVDTGVVPIDSLALDEHETVAQAAAFYADFEARITAEAALLVDLRATVVVGDIPPLAFAAAARAGLPSLAIANFTWDWIYEAYAGFATEAPHVLPTIRQAYAEATQTLRLPLHGGFAAMRAPVRDIPLIARRSPLGRHDARRTLGLSADERVVLASFGAYGADLPYRDVAAHSAFTLVVTDAEARDGGEAAHPRLRRLARRDLKSRGIRYPDLVAAADVVVSKPGYGIVSECVANGAALLYTSRGRFPEQEVFFAEMPEVLRCRFIAPDDLRAGRWSEAVAALLDQPQPPRQLATDGADVAASMILSLAG